MAQRRHELKGKQFGRWLVVKFDKTSAKSKITKWICKCECGIIKSIPTQQLLYGSTTQCRECGYKNRKPTHPIGHLYTSIKEGAIKRNKTFNLSKDEMYNLLKKQNFKCALSGLPLKIVSIRKRTNTNYTTASLDRIDSSKGYVVDNIQWVHRDLNTMKWDIDQDKFIKYCRLVVKTFDASH